MKKILKGILFAFVQGFAFTIAYSGTTEVMTIIKTTVVLTAGTSLLLWIGDQITKHGIGNGLSLLIMAGIIQSLPSVFVTAFNELVLGETFSKGLGAVLFGSFITLLKFAIVLG